MFGMNKRANFGVGIKRATHFDERGTCGQTAREIVEDRFFNQRTRIGGAALAVEAIDLEDGGVEGAVEISVGENYGWRLAAEFERKALQLISPGFHDDGASGGLASKCDQRD